MRTLLLLVLFLAACWPGRGRQEVGAQALRALLEGDARSMARVVAQVFERFNLPVEIPDLAGEQERLAQSLEPGPRESLGPARRVLLFLLAARSVAMAVQQELLPPGEPPASSARLAAIQVAAVVRFLAEQSPEMERAVSSAVERLTALPEALRRTIPPELGEVLWRLRARGPPLEVTLSRVFPTSFDRRERRVLRAAAAARLCPVRTVESSEGTLAAVSPQGDLYLADKGSLRVLSAPGLERRLALAAPLGPGRLVHGAGRLFHVARVADGLEAAVVETSGAKAHRGSVLEVRGSGFLADVAVLGEEVLLALRRVFSGYELVRVDLALGRAVREGAWPGTPGHRDGPLGRARFLPGPFTRTAGGAFLFYDPAARALRILERGFVGTVAMGVGEVVGIVAGTGDRVHLVESERRAGGRRRFRQQLLRLEGLSCP